MKEIKKIWTVVVLSFLFFLILFVRVHSDETGTFLNIIEPLRINSIYVFPETRMVLVNSTLNATMNATSGNGIDRLFAKITLPNSNTATAYLPMNYSPPIPGVYRIIFYANDTSGAIVNSTNYFYSDNVFLAGNNISNLQSAIINGTINLTYGRLTTRLSNGSFIIYNFTCNRICTYEYLIDFLYDYEYQIETGMTKITFRNVNNSVDNNNTITHQRLVNPDGGNILTVGIESNYITPTLINLVLNYTDASYNYENNFTIYKCSSWNFTSKNCSSSWTQITSQISQDKNKKLFEINTTSFSAYKITEPHTTAYCGDGICNGAETGATCPADCTKTIIQKEGGGGISSSYVQELIEKALLEMMKSASDLVLTPPLYIEVYPGDHEETSINTRNIFNKEVTIKAKAVGKAKQFVYFDETSFTLGIGEQKELGIRIAVDKDAKPGLYDGYIEISTNGFSTKIPIVVNVLAEGGKLLDVRLTALKEEVYSGEMIPLEIEMYNLGLSKKVDLQLKIQLLSPDLEEVISEKEETLAIQTSLSLLRNIRAPFGRDGKYVVRAIVYYTNEDNNMLSASIASINIIKSPLTRIVGPIFTAGFMNVLFVLFAILLAMMLAPMRVGLTMESQNFGEVHVKNRIWPFKKEVSTIFIVQEDSLPGENPKLILWNSEINFNKFNGSIVDFFKKALISDAIYTKYNNKTIYAIKKKDREFLSLSFGEEFRIKCKGISDKNSKAYFDLKQHRFDPNMQIKAWNILNLKHITNPKEYFLEMRKLLDKTKLDGTDELKHYIKNIISILQ